MLRQVKIGTKIGASFALGLIIFGAIAAAFYRSTTQQIEASNQESHTYQVLNQLKEVSSTIKDAETGQRGYIITGELRYLDPYNAAREDLDEKVSALQQLLSRSPDQQQNMNRLKELINQRVAVLQKVIDLRQRDGFQAAQRSILTDEGRRLMEQIRQVANDIETDERNLLEQRSTQAELASQQNLNTITYSIPLYCLVLTLIGYFLTRNISQPLRQMSGAAVRLGEGDLSVTAPGDDRQDEVGILATAFNDMVRNLRETTRRVEDQTWLKSNLAELSRLLQGQREQETVAQQVLSTLAPLIQAQQGVFYLLDRETHPPVLKLLGSYAFQERKHLGNQFRLGEGLVGQSAIEKQRILLTEVPSDYIRISSGLGAAVPLNIVVQPIIFEGEISAVMEFASFQRFTELQLTLLEQVSDSLGVVLNTIAANYRTVELLQQSQALTEELQEQQDELQESNRRLEEQAEALRTSETLLKEQQEELQQANEELQQLNEELEEKAELLAVQKQDVEQKNLELEQARQALIDKAEQLSLSSRYKSEFLANMSHELRTPLNSLLILARMLSDNSEGNLTEKQVEYSRTIYSAGTDLLSLINDVLDLAKIESGTLAIEYEFMPFTQLREFLERTFRQLAIDKKLAFQILLDLNLPGTLLTDPRRLQQILKNLLANAFKFTQQGSVELRISPVMYHFDDPLFNSQMAAAIAFAVSDTGIGIPPEKQRIIFEAFQQVDGTTSRRFGGTGLGLSISRELTERLGGRLELTSQVGQGSTFTLYLPVEPPLQAASAENGQGQAKSTLSETPETAHASRVTQPSQTEFSETALLTTSDMLSPDLVPSGIRLPLPNEANDDRDAIQPGDLTLLIIEDDISFARILMEMARQQGFKVLIALSGSSGLLTAQEFHPNAIMLDIRLPGIDGWTVLDRLKHDPSTRHIPVHILSVDDSLQKGLQLGAIAYLQKPVSRDELAQALVKLKGFIERPVRNLLVIEDDTTQAESIRELIGNGDVQTTIVNSGTEALSQLQVDSFDCIVLDLGLPDMSGFELIEEIKQTPTLSQIPIIVYTGKELTLKEETQLRRLAETIIIKDVRSPERLLDETALFLHRVQANLPQSKRQMLEKLHHIDPVLTNRKILIVDDDVRNIFALTGLLEQYEIEIVYAENGRDAITVLQQNLDIDLVLMDIMMPEMDGYETTRLIRRQEGFKSLPVIALTAKAMHGDREKCLEAGASDYITKPVDPDQLLSLLRVWLYQSS